MVQLLWMEDYFDVGNPLNHSKNTKRVNTF
jgi:hypothetical protein